MRFCPNCGNPVQEGGMFCTACGFSLKSVMEELAEPVAAVQPAAEEPVQEPVYEAPAPEPVYEAPSPEPVYQEPVYQEPVYQEPVFAASAAGYVPPQGGYVPPQSGYVPPQGYGAPVFNNNIVMPNHIRPALQLPTGRGLAKMIFLGLITLGIYNIVILSRIAQEINITACRTDGKRTMSYFGASLLGPLTLFIYPIVWQHKLCNRIGEALQYRGINYKFSAATMWLWGVLGSLIIVGPFIYIHKFMKSMNLINGHYNING